MTAPQQSQVIIEPADNFHRGQHPHAGRSQLDSQGNAVHSANDRLNCPGGILAQLEP